MKPLFALLLTAMTTPAANTNLAMQIRNKPQSIALFPGVGTHKGTVLFLPGDGGWRGVAVTIAERVANFGYTVYGFDTKIYLESFSASRAALTTDQMREDMLALLEWVHSKAGEKVTVLGWSQGGGMAVLAVAAASPDLVRGVVTLGLPETAVLGWNWKDTIASAAHIEPDEPHFAVEPFLKKLSGTPLWMIHGTADEYTSRTIAYRMFQSAQQPKRLVTVPGANHRFDLRRVELFQALEEGFLWMTYGGSTVPAAASR